MKFMFFILSCLLTLQLHAKGPCDCPDNYDKRGHRCGRRSAFCKPGGYEPACGTKNQKEKMDLFKRAC
jgi:hypothetical protein